MKSDLTCRSRIASICSLLTNLGATRIWLSSELTLRQIEELGEVSPVPLGATIMGYTELMVTEHCLLMSQGPCNRDCAQCARRKSPHYLKDRKGYELPVITDVLGEAISIMRSNSTLLMRCLTWLRRGYPRSWSTLLLMNVEQVSKEGCSCSACARYRAQERG